MSKTKKTIGKFVMLHKLIKAIGDLNDGIQMFNAIMADPTTAKLLSQVIINSTGIFTSIGQLTVSVTTNPEVIKACAEMKKTFTSMDEAFDSFEDKVDDIIDPNRKKKSKRTRTHTRSRTIKPTPPAKYNPTSLNNQLSRAAQQTPQEPEKQNEASSL